ncbi:NTP transferase domain-containing protein [Candidatus Woesearchaeota archaeon]|nr:NTP transferase domain-containing protein [Candidatus Woesearchaeota archaeon]
MKAVIFAAGKGTRMLPLTEHTNKVLIPVNGKPFLWYVIDTLQKAGVTDLGIVVSYKQDQIEKFLSQFNIQATLIHQDQPLGTGHALKCAASFVGRGNFLVCPGDNLVSIADIKRVIGDAARPQLLGLRHEHPEHYGVLQVENGLLKHVVEKPKQFIGDLINTGVYFFTNDIFTHLKNISRQASGEYYLTDAVTALAHVRPVRVLTIEGFWLDLGKPTDVPIVEEELHRRKIY